MLLDCPPSSGPPSGVVWSAEWESPGRFTRTGASDALPESVVDESFVRRLREILVHHRGRTETQLRLLRAESTVRMAVPQYPVALSPGLYADLKALLGPDCVE